MARCGLSSAIQPHVKDLSIVRVCSRRSIMWPMSPARLTLWDYVLSCPVTSHDICPLRHLRTQHLYVDRATCCLLPPPVWLSLVSPGGDALALAPPGELDGVDFAALPASLCLVVVVRARAAEFADDVDEVLVVLGFFRSLPKY